MWGYLEYRGGYHEYRGGYLEYRGGCSVPWGISWCTWGISWVPWRVFSTVGGKSFVIWVPHGTEHPHGTHDIPHMYHDIPPRYSNFKGWYPPTVLNTPHGTHDIPPHASWYPPKYWTSPTVLKITPHGTHDIPHGTEHPPTVLKISPHIYHDIPPRYWTPPTVLKIFPHGTHDIPHGTEHPHGTENPPRYCTHIIQGEVGGDIFDVLKQSRQARRSYKAQNCFWIFEYKCPEGGGLLAMLEYPGMCHFPGYTFCPKILKQHILFAQKF